MDQLIAAYKKLAKAIDASSDKKAAAALSCEGWNLGSTFGGGHEGQPLP